ncbi:FAT domain-domain-containing protein, partial [Protomyces lactucae-debilis]
LRGFTTFMRKYAPVIPGFVVRLLQDCPPEMSAARKELLVATRHILSTDFRNAFIGKIEQLLNEDVLIGSGVTSRETLKPLAFSMLADLIHHVRAELSPLQIEKTISIYSKNLGDTSLTTSIQTMSAKLLLNLIDRIMKLPEQPEGRRLLVLILLSFTKKIANLNQSYERNEKALQEPSREVRTFGIHVGSLPAEGEPEVMKEGKHLFKNLMVGLKTVLFGLKGCNPPLPPNMSISNQHWAEAVRGLGNADLQIFTTLFLEGAKGFSYYKQEILADKTNATERNSLENPVQLTSPGSREEKDVLETFATVFIHIDPVSFQEILEKSLPAFYELAMGNNILLHVPQFFLTNDSTSSNFAGLLLEFLIEKLPELGSTDSLRSTVLLRLFKMCFMAVTMFPDLNEVILQPHLAEIIIQSMKLSASAKNPINYYILLRALFRSIGGGRFELLYKEVLPLLQVLLECLNSLLQSARKAQERELYVELCLTVPVRLSVLLPYLSYLMNPLVIALEAGPDLVTQGLRTLELCIDNLTQEFLDPILAPVLEKLMKALWSHLKPLPYTHQHSHAALRVLGKMGGRNRRFIDADHAFDATMAEHYLPSIPIAFEGIQEEHRFMWSKFVLPAADTLKDLKASIEYKTHSFAFLKAVASLYVQPFDSTTDLAGRLRTAANTLVEQSSKSEAVVKPSQAILRANKASRIHGQLYERILEGLCYAVSVPTLADEAKQFLSGLFRHFSMLLLLDAEEQLMQGQKIFSLDEPKTDLHLDSEIALDVLVLIITSENEAVRDLGEELITVFVDTLQVIVSEVGSLAQIPLFATMLGKFCHCCYQAQWYVKAGGTSGLAVLLEKLNLGTVWTRLHELEMIKALIYVVKDVPPEAPASCVEDACRLLKRVVATCHEGDSEGEKDTTAIATALISDLLNPNGKVREIVQDLFKALAELTKTPLQNIIKPVQDRLLMPIFTKPLRALPYAMQIGHIDAITFCLSLEPSFLEFNDALIRLLHEALVLTDADDEALGNGHKISSYKSSAALITLRTVCIRLLTIAVSSSEFSNPTHAQSRSKIIAVFFKSLYSKSSEVVDVANKGLKQVLSQNHKLPKDLLQAGLRPILMNLSDHKRLTVPGLEGLARLLELLTNYFKVEIGKKLLDHLRAWADPLTLQQIASKPLKDQQSIKIIAAILNIFHLLPPSAHMFLDELVSVILELEVLLRRTTDSPLRPSFLKFINRYPQETWDYLISKFDSAAISTFLIQLMDDETSKPLRDIAHSHILEMVRQESPTAEESSSVAKMNVLRLSNVLSRHQDDAFSEIEDLEHLLKLFSTLTEAVQSGPDRQHLVDIRVIAEGLVTTFVRFLKSNTNDLQPLFLLMAAEADGKLDASLALERTIQTAVVEQESLDLRRRYLSQSLLIFSGDHSSTFKIGVFRRIVNPMLARDHEAQGKSGLVDRSLVETIHTNVWKVALSDFGEDKICATDVLRIELLQMSTLLIQKYSSLLSRVRKDILFFAWNYIKLEDLTTKHAAYVFISFFIAAYDTPAKITAQIYVALLKAFQPEARTLVRQALDVLAPVLSQRIPSTAQEEKFGHKWAKYPRKVLSEENNTMQLIPVYQFIVRQSNMFYDCREQFIDLLVSALPKLGFPQNSNSDSRLLSVEICETILEWHQRQDSSMDTSEDGNAGYQMSVEACTDVLKFLVKAACLPGDSTKSQSPQRLLAVMRALLSSHVWSAMQIDLTSVEAAVLKADEKTQGAAVHALEALHIVLSTRTKEKLYAYVPETHVWLEKLLKSESAALQTNLQPVLRMFLQSLPEAGPDDDEDDVATQFKGLLVASLNENLQTNANLQGTILLLGTLAAQSPTTLDTLLPAMMKLFNNLIKEHLNVRSTTQTAVAGAPEAPSTLADPEIQAASIIALMDLMSLRMLHLGDQRRLYLAAVAQLIEKSPDISICMHILKLTSAMVLVKKDPFPTVKEKVSLLLKMTSFDNRGNDELANGFLRLVVAIYKDPSIARTELTVRLEQAFLIGTRARNVAVRAEFMEIFNSSMSKILFTRLNYIFVVQNWESLSSHYWVAQANHLLLGALASSRIVRLDKSTCLLRPLVGPGDLVADVIVDDELTKASDEHKSFLANISVVKSEQVFEPLGYLQHLSNSTGEMLWIQLLSTAWMSVCSKDQDELTKLLAIHLSKEYHLRQADKRPNVISSHLKALARIEPSITLPPHLIKYLGKSFSAWYVAIELLERSADATDQVQSGSALTESRLDALTELYAALGEDDMFYGLWRRRCRYLETNLAISYEQNGMWDKAQQLYEAAQVKARTGILPFSESEYTLWEDHWILCAQKMQQWDVLTDLAKQEGYSDLLLECAWRISDWTTDREPLEASIKSLMEVPTSRRYTFEAFMALQKTQAKLDTIQEFQRVCDEGMQLSLRKWSQLPVVVSSTHVPLLQSFQQYVELQEASSIYASLATTHAQNLEAKSHELKHILQTWRERLPNFYDDINSWSDLVAWRQLVFSSINRVFLPLVPGLQQPAGASGNSSATSFAYRGYHETAWIINRFAHVARKHQLPDVCISQLTKIYTLPNIEIQEAFLKLREQAKCHYQNPNELGMGLEVISNTNLMYFGTQQKAEFFTLKGMFLAKLKLNEEANQAFATAIQIDLTLPKAWAEWGQYSDRLFQEDAADVTKAGNAVSCYLQAAGLFKNGRARKMLSRVLWLLSLDDAQGTISSAFDSYKGEVPTWYWISFIPQLLTSLSHKEARHARQVLIKIAKAFPQALHFQLRTTKEDYAIIKKQAVAAAQSASAAKASADATELKTKTTASDTSAQSDSKGSAATAKAESPEPGASAQSTTATRQPWEHVDEIMAILKTAFPLLALSMETMVDQIQQRFKCQADEDAYRLIVALLNDGVQYIGRLGTVTEDTRLPPATQANITRFAESVLPKNIKSAFEQEFVVEKPNLQQYVAKLRRWRDKFEIILDRRKPTQQLEQVSAYLSEFQYQKFEDVEVPGQYLQHRDNNNDFVRIDRFMPQLDVVRGHGICYRRITMRGQDGSLHQFAIQYPAARHCRREERIIQLFRILSGVLARRKESRKRCLSFHLPAAIPLAPHIRIVQDDASYISLQGIYEDYCNRHGQHKDDPLQLATERLQKYPELQNKKSELIDLKVDILASIRRDLVPESIVYDFFKQTFPTFSEFWRFRKQFSLQYASLTFMTYVMNINNRFPYKLFISRKTGQVWGTEILPGMAPNNPVFHNGEAVPFRLTPALQNLMGPIGIEGIFSCATMAIARCLTEPEFELDQHLSIFVRDELITWFTQQHRPVTHETHLREKVSSNVDLIVRRASSLSQVAQGNLPANQTIIDLISQSVNPKNLVQMDQLWSSFL